MVGGYLFSKKFSKKVKPPNNVPYVKSKYSLLGSFHPIQTAGKRGELITDRVTWEKALVLLSKYFLDVEMLGHLDDPLYN